MPTGDPLHFTATSDYHTLAEGWFLMLVHARELRHVRGARWVTSAQPATLALRAHGHVAYADSGTEELVVDVGRAVAHLILRERLVTARVAARGRAELDAALERLRMELPPSGRDAMEASVRFWWLDGQLADSVARIIRVPCWEEIAANYPVATAAQLDALVDWRDGPPGGGRLLIWHGPSGSGKTHAVQMLAGAWRAWADFHVISDPEQFLGSPGYLMAVAGRDEGDGEEAHRWRVAVLEDAGEHLARDRVSAQDPALARLLNLCDGLLGQAARMLVLVTTNLSPRHLHPALRRPGRQLAEVAFEPFGREEIAQWCTARDVPPLERGEATLAELYAHAEGRAPAPATPVFGFAVSDR